MLESGEKLGSKPCSLSLDRVNSNPSSAIRGVSPAGASGFASGCASCEAMRPERPQEVEGLAAPTAALRVQLTLEVIMTMKKGMVRSGTIPSPRSAIDGRC